MPIANRIGCKIGRMTARTTGAKIGSKTARWTVNRIDSRIANKITGKTVALTAEAAGGKQIGRETKRGAYDSCREPLVCLHTNRVLAMPSALRVMFLAGNMMGGLILRMGDSAAFLVRHHTIGLGVIFHPVDVFLLLVQSIRFPLV